MTYKDVFGFAFDKNTGAMYDDKGKYTGFSFYNVFILDPVGGLQEGGVIAYASYSTAQTVLKLFKDKVVPDEDWKCELVDTVWTGFKAVDNKGKEVPQYQIKVTNPEGNSEKFNAGLVANEIMRNPDYDFSTLKASLPK